MISSINDLPSELITFIGSFLPPKDLSNFSKTNKYNQKYCGILKLNWLYSSALRQFKSLQNDFIIKSRRSDLKDPLNVYKVTLIDDKSLYSVEPPLKFTPDCIKKFAPIFAYISERNEFFCLESVDDVLQTLEDRQFILAVRLGKEEWIATQIPPNTSFISKLYFQYVNPDTANLICTYRYPIKELRSSFPDHTKIIKLQIAAINKAVENALKSNLFTGVSGINFLLE